MDCNNYLAYKANQTKFEEYKKSLSKSVVIGAYSFKIDSLKEDQFERWFEKYKVYLAHTTYEIQDNEIVFCFECAYNLPIQKDEKDNYFIETNNPYTKLVEDYEKTNEYLRNEFKDFVHKTEDLSAYIVYDSNLYTLTEDNKMILEKE